MWDKPLFMKQPASASFWAVLSVVTSELYCCTGWDTKQAYYVRKAIHIRLMMKWCKCQDVFVYKSYTMVNVFWGNNIVLCKDPH